MYSLILFTDAVLFCCTPACYLLPAQFHAVFLEKKNKNCCLVLFTLQIFLFVFKLCETETAGHSESDLSTNPPAVSDPPPQCACAPPPPPSVGVAPLPDSSSEDMHRTEPGAPQKQR